MPDPIATAAPDTRAADTPAVLARASIHEAPMLVLGRTTQMGETYSGFKVPLADVVAVGPGDPASPTQGAQLTVRHTDDEQAMGTLETFVLTTDEDAESLAARIAALRAAG